MAQFTIVREVTQPPAEAWAVLTDWPRQAPFVPFTTIRRTEDGFVARTALGPVGFDDPMQVVEWRDGEFCRLEKTGRVVRGWAELTVRPSGTGSRITWREEVDPIGTPPLAGPLVAGSGRWLFGRVLDGLFGT